MLQYSYSLKEAHKPLDTFKHNSRIGQSSFFLGATVFAREDSLKNELKAVILEELLADESLSQGR